MALTAEVVYRYIKHALGEAELSAGLVAQNVMNHAGEWLTDAYDWRWKTRPPATLSTVAGQDYIVLPADVGEILGDPVSVTGGPLRPIKMTDVLSVGKMRQISPGTQTTTGFFAALVYSARSGTTPPQKRLELWPTPSTAEAIAKIYYRATWERLTDDNQTVSLPPFMEGLYLQVARAWAQGLEDEDMMSHEDRIQRIMNGPGWAACVARDQGEQTSYGTMADGLAAQTGELADPNWANVNWTLPGA